MQAETGKPSKVIEKVCEDRISALPEDLLVEILLLVPTKVAVATATLSKRWRDVWKKLPRLEYMDKCNKGYKRVWWFLVKSLLQLGEGPVIEKLRKKLRPSCPINVDLGKWTDNVVERCIQRLHFKIRWSAEPTSLSKRLYTCKTLRELSLSNKILLDVPSEASLPSLVELRLSYVMYKDEDSLVRLLSSCPVLQNLYVNRERIDNVTNFSVKVPSLQLFKYTNYYTERDIGWSLVIDSPGLKLFSIYDFWGNSCLIENMPPCLDMAKVHIYSHPNDNFLRSLSSVMYLNLTLVNEVDAICTTISFSRLRECKLTPPWTENWVQSIMHLLHNSPKLRVLMINSNYPRESEDLPLSHSVPECLSSSLEIFEWEKYGGKREETKLLTYIFANSKCLKTVRISLMLMKKKNHYSVKTMKELESMHRVSESSQLIFTTQFRWSSMKKHPAYQVMSF